MTLSTRPSGRPIPKVQENGDAAAMSNDDPRHGTNAGYLAHMRTDRDACQPCRTAHVRYEKRRMHDAHLGQPRLIDATGTRRRIEALVALGWTYRAIGEQVGVSLSGVHKAINRYTVIRRDVAERYAAAYDAMCMTLPPMETRQQKRDANYARTVARKHGYRPPLAWDDIDNDPEPPAHEDADHVDPVLVERVVAGEFGLRTTPAERGEVARRWVESGRSLRALRDASGWKPERYLKLGEDAA